jgi:hypothetical protein
MIGKPLLAPLVLVTGTPSRRLQGQLGAEDRAVPTAISIAIAADDEGLAALLALEDPPAQHPSSIRKLGAGDAARQTPPDAASTAPVEDPVPPCKSSSRVFVYVRARIVVPESPVGRIPAGARLSPGYR